VSGAWCGLGVTRCGEGAARCNELVSRTCQCHFCSDILVAVQVQLQDFKAFIDQFLRSTVPICDGIRSKYRGVGERLKNKDNNRYFRVGGRNNYSRRGCRETKMAGCHPVPTIRLAAALHPHRSPPVHFLPLTTPHPPQSFLYTTQPFRLSAPCLAAILTSNQSIITAPTGLGHRSTPSLRDTSPRRNPRPRRA
jgi:hypothetical protein